MKLVGLTGNIGAGKSTIALIFKELGVPIFDADWVGKKMLAEDQEVINEIKNIFGAEVFNQNGLDRKKIASIVFKNQTALSQLNAIIHPRVAREFKSWVKNQKSEIVIREAAILVESNVYLDLDALIVVVCSEEERIRRVMLRDQVTKEEVQARINRQIPESEKIKVANYVIDNNEGVMVLPQVLSILNKLGYADS